MVALTQPRELLPFQILTLLEQSLLNLEAFSDLATEVAVQEGIETVASVPHDDRSAVLLELLHQLGILLPFEELVQTIIGGDDNGAFSEVEAGSDCTSGPHEQDEQNKQKPVRLLGRYPRWLGRRIHMFKLLLS